MWISNVNDTGHNFSTINYKALTEVRERETKRERERERERERVSERE